MLQEFGTRHMGNVSYYQTMSNQILVKSISCIVLNKALKFQVRNHARHFLHAVVKGEDTC